jgi:hypothetical protein
MKINKKNNKFNINTNIKIRNNDSYNNNNNSFTAEKKYLRNCQILSIV